VEQIKNKMSVLKTFTFVFLCATLTFLYVCGAASAATIYVPDDYSTIQDAVNASFPGDTIVVRDGTYAGNVFVNIPYLTIKSENGSANCVVQYVYGGYENAFTLNADGVKIEGFTITGIYSGIYTYSDSNIISSNNISSNLYGIFLYDSSNNTISDNNISNNVEGIFLYDSSNNTISDNNISNNVLFGIFLSNSSKNIVSGNEFTNDGLFVFVHSYQNSVFDNTVNGRPLIYLEDESNRFVDYAAGQVILVNCNNITVKNQELTNTDVGIELFYSHNCLISENNISNNVEGIFLYDSSNNAISENNISNNADGIRLYDSSNNIIYFNNFNNSDNVYSYNSKNIWNTTEQITYVYKGVTYTNYMGNYWSDYTGSDADGDGIGDTPYSIDSDKDNYPLMERFENYFAAENKPPIADFTYMPEYPIVDQTVEFDASSSYDPDGTIVSYDWDFGDGAKASGDVVTHAYSSAGNHTVILTVTDNEGEKNSTSKMISVITKEVIYVPDDYEKIQWAVDNAGVGDTIVVRDGFYVENIDVDKSLTIRSENGSTNCVVRAANLYDHVFYVTADNVTIKGFTVTMATGYHKAGIFLYNSDYCRIENVNAFNNNYGIRLYSSSKNNIIANNTASSNGGGIYLKYSCNNNIIANNTVRSNNEDGIYLYYSSNNTIANNTLLNNYYGIYLDSSSNSIIANNTVSSNNEDGIYLWHSSSNTIANNIVPNNICGIYLWYSSNNIIYLNNFINNTYQVESYVSTNIWNSTEKINYTYNGKQHTNYLGNYWSDYTGSDADGDGIGDTPYSIDSDKDNYPLMERFENYPSLPATSIIKKTGSHDIDLHKFSFTQDTSGNLHVVFVEKIDDNKGILYYARSTDGGITWQIEELTTINMPERAILAVDKNGKAYIAYNDVDYSIPGCHKRDLYACTNVEGSWKRTLIKEAWNYWGGGGYGYVQYYIPMDIIVDKDNIAHLYARQQGWWAYGGDIWEYTYRNGSWNGPVDTGVGGGVDVDGSNSESFHVNIKRNGDYYAVWADGRRYEGGYWTVNYTYIVQPYLFYGNRSSSSLTGPFSHTQVKSDAVWRVISTLDSENNVYALYNKWPLGTSYEDYAIRYRSQGEGPHQFLTTIAFTKNWGNSTEIASMPEWHQLQPRGVVVTKDDAVFILWSHYNYNSSKWNASYYSYQEANGTWHTPIFAGSGISAAVRKNYFATPSTFMYVYVDSQNISDQKLVFIRTPTLNQLPIANFTYSPLNPVVKQPITFNASSSYDPDGNITKYDWDFGDGAKASGDVVTHAYSSAGNYTVILTVTDNEGEKNSTSKTISVITKGVIYVPDDYEKIQWAVDNATAGDTIIVRDGTYYENVVVDKQLTIKSENGSDNCIR